VERQRAAIPALREHGEDAVGEILADQLAVVRLAVPVAANRLGPGPATVEAIAIAATATSDRS
jgi:hypothetical protein